METKFMHFTNWKVDELNDSIEYSTASWKISNYWSNKLKGSFSCEMNFSDTGLSLLKNIQIGEEPLLEMLAPYFRQMKYSSELLKEYIFEDVRRKNYPQLPSRTRCMFLFGSNCDPGEYAKGIGFDAAKYTLIEINPSPETCQIHFGDYRLLNCNMHNFEVITEYAEQYWHGCSSLTNYTEVLFEGAFRVTKVP